MSCIALNIDMTIMDTEVIPMTIIDFDFNTVCVSLLITSWPK